VHILVVDDQVANRGLLGFMLEEEGHSVVEAADGLECLAKFESAAPDLILMDVMMPGMDGYEAARRLKEQTDVYVPIIFLTALSDDMSLSRCLESGGDDYLTKPINETLLNAKIKAHERIRDLTYELRSKNTELQKLHGVLRGEHNLAEYVFESAISGQLEFQNLKHYLSPMGGFSGDVILAGISNRNTLIVMLGDFTGHGLPAALGALPVKQQFDAMVSEGASVGDIARQLNATLYEYLPGNMFCAATIAELSNDGRTATCWMGGLPDLFVLDNRGLIRKVIGSTHMALGVFSDNQFKRDVYTIDLKEEERLILYSDGVIESSNIDGGMLGEAGFEVMFDGQTPIDGLFDHIVRRLQQFSEGRPQDDDVSLLEISAKSLSANEANERFGLHPKNFTMTWHIDRESLQQSDPVQDVFDLWAVPVSLRGKIDEMYVYLTKLLHNVIESIYLDATAGDQVFGRTTGCAVLSKSKLKEAIKTLEIDKVSLLVRYDAKEGALLLAASTLEPNDYIAEMGQRRAINITEDNNCYFTTVQVAS